MEISELVKKEKINSFNNFNDLEFDNIKVIGFHSVNFDGSVEDYLYKNCELSSKKVDDGLKMLLLDDSILKKNFKGISTGEKIKLQIVLELLNNSEVIYLYKFDKYFMEKELLFFKKLFKKIVSKYKKTVVLIDCNLTFLFDLANRIVVQNKKNNILIFGKDDFYNPNLLKYFTIPLIIEFVQYVNKEKKIINEYIDLKELIKEIYREVEHEVFN